MKQFIRPLLTWLLRPLLQEPVYFLVFLFTMGKSVFVSLLKFLVGQVPEVCWGVNFGELFILSYLATWIVYKASSLYGKLFGYLFLLSIFFIREFLNSVFLTDISSSALTLLAETNLRESIEFFQYYLLTWGACKTLCLTLLVVVVIVLAERRRHCIVRLLSGHLQPLSIVVILGLLWGAYSGLSYVRLLECQDLDQLSEWDYKEAVYADPLTKTVSAFQGLRLATNDMSQYVNLTDKACSFPLDNSLAADDSLNIVIVIGESFIKWHSNLYGYPLPTCPSQQTEWEKGNLFVFNNVRTSANLTHIALRNILSCNSSHRGEKWNEAPYFPALMKQAGYDVFFWDNQRTAFSSMAISFSLESFLYNDSICRMAYTQQNTTTFDYDAQLVADYALNAHAEGKANLVLFHLMGQHFDAAERFPAQKRYQVFSGKDVPLHASYLTADKRQEIADYDNATRYNDEVLDCIFDLYRQKNAVVIYFPDHGEEIYDYRDSKGRTDTDSLFVAMDRHQYQVPFVVWCSDKYQESHPQEVEAIASSVDKTLYTDDVCQMVFHLGRVNTRYYQPQRDVLSSAYVTPTTFLTNPLYLIAHAGGETDGYIYTNSREALLKSVESGYQYIELDLGWSADSVLICVHDGEKWGGNGQYTAMTFQDAVDIWRQHSFVLVLDKISDVRVLNRYFKPEERGRVLVEAFSKGDYVELKQAGYVPMLSFYNMTFASFMYLLKLRYVDRIAVDKITAHTQSNFSLLRFLRNNYGIKVAMFTSNSPDFFYQHVGKDADFIYTDNWNIREGCHFNQQNVSTY